MIFILGFLALCLGIACVFFMLKLFQNKAHQKLEIESELKSLLGENATLRSDLARKTSQIIKFSQGISDLEQIVQSHENREDLTQEFINIKNISLDEKELLLMLIPTLDPIKNSKPSEITFNKKQALKFSATPKTPVFATASGVVNLVIRGQKDFGTYIVISHGFGFSSFYSGIGKFYVEQGDVVQKGQHIADTSKHANSLIYQVNFLKLPLDPKNYLGLNVDNIDNIFNDKIRWNSLFWLVSEMVSLKNQSKVALSEK